MRASESEAPVEKPRAEKKERRDFQVTEEDIRSTPLLMKWPFSFNVAGSIPKVRAMEPKSSLWSSQATTGTSFDSDGQNSFIVLFFSSAIAPNTQNTPSLSVAATSASRSNGFWKCVVSEG